AHRSRDRRASRRGAVGQRRSRQCARRVAAAARVESRQRGAEGNGAAARALMRASAYLAALALLLAACATIAPREAARVADAATLAAPFDVQGRLSARRGTDGGAANFTWEHRAASDRVELATPLGQTLARLAGDADGVHAQFPDGRTLDAPGWDALTARVIGVPVPVAGLTAWLRGYAH